MEELLNQIEQHIGGCENISKTDVRGDRIYITVKDAGKVDSEKICGLENVAEAELNRSRLRILACTGTKEDKAEMAGKNYREMSVKILEKVGGKENVTLANHCMTRLRLNLADKEKAQVEELKKINNVLGAQFSGEELHIIIGPDVSKLYDEFCRTADVAVQKAVDENPDGMEIKKDKTPFSLKKAGGNIMTALTGCLTPLIPAMVVAGMLKMAAAVLGDMMGVLSAESDIYRLLTFAGDAGFYFFPVMIGYTGAKKFGCSPILGILMGGILLHPTMLEIVAAGEAFTVFGIPMTPASYGSSVIPMILITWIMSYVEKFFKKYIPGVLSVIFTPLLTILVMLPLGLCLLAPLGTILSNYVVIALTWIYETTGPLGIGVVSALWIPLVATGMHVPLITTVVVSLTTMGYDAIILPGVTAAVYAMIGTELGFALKAKSPEDRGLGISCLLSQALGGVGEPALFGILLRNKKAFTIAMIGCFFSGLTAGLLKVKAFMFTPSNVMAALAYGADIGKGAAACVVGFVVSLVLMLILGYEDKPKAK